MASGTEIAKYQRENLLLKKQIEERTGNQNVLFAYDNQQRYVLKVLVLTPLESESSRSQSGNTSPNRGIFSAHMKSTTATQGMPHQINTIFINVEFLRQMTIH